MRTLGGPKAFPDVEIQNDVGFEAGAPKPEGGPSWIHSSGGELRSREERPRRIHLGGGELRSA